ncbi:MAG: hypothetical protein Ta2A_03810 [Treponemataceae bacterium]|nr:MAG: hypothetical protein Ta2A_03810 [Treponemataceae bacterium]
MTEFATQTRGGTDAAVDTIPPAIYTVRMRKLFILSGLILLNMQMNVFSQTSAVQTAGNFFKTISDYYASIRDYTVNINVRADKSSMAGTVIFKRPGLLRINFTTPSRQVVLFNGDMLTVYIPGRSAILNQAVNSNENQGVRMASAQGLSLMSRYYSVAFEAGQDPVPLEDGSEESVIKLLLTRKTSAEGFSTIKLAINPNSRLIRRMEGITPQGVSYIFNFSSYRLNQGISDQSFIFDPPSTVNNYNNFLFSD